MSSFYHFAYGANMNYSELKKYIKKNIKVVGVGYLDNYTFKYRTIKNRKITAKASIEKKKNHRVYGIIFKIYGSIEKLHEKEKSYYVDFKKIKLLYPIKPTKKKNFNCFVYLMKENVIGKQGKPSRKYENNITTAAAIYNFPLSYINKHLTYYFEK